LPRCKPSNKDADNYNSSNVTVSRLTFRYATKHKRNTFHKTYVSLINITYVQSGKGKSKVHPR